MNKLILTIAITMMLFNFNTAVTGEQGDGLVFPEGDIENSLQGFKPAQSNSIKETTKDGAEENNTTLDQGNLDQAPQQNEETAEINSAQEKAKGLLNNQSQTVNEDGSKANVVEVVLVFLLTMVF
jgi:hypothetical protein